MFVYECSRCNITVISKENEEWVFCDSCGGVAGAVIDGSLEGGKRPAFYNPNEEPVTEPLGLKNKECGEFNNPVTFINPRGHVKDGFR